MCICCTLFLIIIWLVLMIVIPLSLQIEKPVVISNNTKRLPSSSSTSTQVIGLENTQYHHDKSVSDFSLNVFAKFLKEYVETMGVEDCYVCMKLPSSVAEGVTYHHISATYGITCSVIASLFYKTGKLEYYYSDLDEQFVNIPVVSELNKVKQAKRMGEFFLQKHSLTSEYVFKNNLTCKMRKEEKQFLDMVEERRQKFQRKAITDKLHSPPWLHKEGTYEGKGDVAMALDWAQQGKFCIYREKTAYDNYFIGSSNCQDSYRIMGGWGFKGGNDPVFPGIYYICGNKAYYKLPDHWYGTCYLGIVFPKIYHIDHGVNGIHEISHFRTRRSSFTEIVGDIFGALIPAVGVSLNSYRIRKLSTVVDRLSTDTAGGFLMVDTEMVAMRAMVMQNRLALDIILAKEGGVCGMLKVQHCCTYIPNKDQDIKRYIKNITDLHREIVPLESKGAWEKIRNGFSTVTNWFSSIGSTLVGKVIIPITLVIIFILICKLIVECMRRKRRNREVTERIKIDKNSGKNEGARNKIEIELEEMKESMLKGEAETKV